MRVIKCIIPLPILRWGRFLQPFQVNRGAVSSVLQPPSAALINVLNEVLCVLQQKS